MKKILLLTIAVLAAVLTTGAQVAGGNIQIENLTVKESDGRVWVNFTAEISKRTAKRNQTYVFSPVLTDGAYKVSLRPVIIEGKGTKTVRARQEWISGITPDYRDGIHAENGQRVTYRADVEAQEWMHGGQLKIEGVTGGCCNYTSDRDALLADNLQLREEPKPIELVTEVQRFAPRSVGDSLSMIFPFVLPETMYDKNDPYKIYDEERDNSMIVFFHQGKSDIDRYYRDNRLTLINLTAAVEMILADPNSNVERVVVAGFASPEGSFSFNDRLAFNRAVAVKQHILQTTALRDQQVMVYNGSVDWRGLRLLVERSNMPEKYQIMDIIDNVPIWDNDQQKGRLGELMRLKGGEPYRYMYQEFFPLLRNGAFIKVYYNNR